MVIKTVTNADAGTADIIGGDDWDQLAGIVNNLHDSFAYLVTKVGSTYYAISGAGGSGVLTSGPNGATVGQAALNALTVGRTWKERVKFKGTFNLTGLTIPSYTTLDLNDAYLIQTAATDTNFIINSDTSGGNTQIEILGGSVDGNKANQTLDAVPYNTRNTINLTKCTNSSVHDVTITNSNSSGIYFDKCTNVSAIRNTIVTPRKIGIAAYGTTAGDGAYYWIKDNYIDTPSENGIASISVTDLFIESNAVISAATSGINCNGLRAHLKRNYIKDCTTIGMAIGAEGSFLGDYCEIIDNFVEGAKTGGISCNVSVGGDYLVVKNNKVSGAASGQSTTAYGLRFTHTHNGICDGNQVWNWQAAGITVEGHNATALGRLGDTDNAIVSNNICWDNGGNTSGAAQARVGISLFGDVGYINNVHVYGNRCYDSGVATQLYGLRFINTTDSLIHDNDFRGNVTSGIQDAGGNI